MEIFTKKLTPLLGTALFMIMGINVSLAQVICNGSAADGTAVNVIYAVESETPLGGGLCDYVLSLTIETVNGNPAPSDITANTTINVGGTMENFSITLPSGQSSKQLPNTPMPESLPCGLAGTISTQIVGGSSCLDQEAVLPVELIKFETVPTQDNTVKLIWETASETDNFGFEVQRSTDAYKWENVAFIKGNGTSLERHKYEWTDNKPLGKLYSYYRLKQIDMDEDYEYSNILVFKTNKNGALNFFPNPVADHMVIDLEKADKNSYDLEVQLFDIVGRLIETSSIEISGSQLYINNLDDLDKGTYFLIVSSNQTGDKYKVKFVKN